MLQHTGVKMGRYAECPICLEDETITEVPTLEAVDTCRGDIDTGYVLVCPKCDYQKEIDNDDYERWEE